MKAQLQCTAVGNGHYRNIMQAGVAKAELARWIVQKSIALYCDLYCFGSRAELGG